MKNKIKNFFNKSDDLSTIHWKHYQLNGSVALTPATVASYISSFWEEAFNFRNNSDKHLVLMMQVKFESKDLMTKNIGQMRRVNFEDMDLYINYIQNYLGLLTDIYKEAPVDTLSFNYIIQDEQASGDNRFDLPLFDAKVHTHLFRNIELPLTMKPTQFGQIEGVEINSDHTKFFVQRGNNTFIIKRYTGGVNKCKLLANNIEWTDTKTDFGFIRELGNTSYYVENGAIVVKKKLLKLKEFKGHRKEKRLNSNIMAMDLETILAKGVHKPYCINLFTGREHITEYLTSLSDMDLFSRFITRVIDLARVNQLSKLNIFAHNGGKFDYVLLIEHLMPFGEVKPLVSNGRFISIELKTNVKVMNSEGDEVDKEITLIFKDSLQLLNAKLSKLAKAFYIGTFKGNFPYKLYEIFYTGVLPQIQYWSNILPEDYSKLVTEFLNKQWNFQEESIKYCRQDCVVLYKVLMKFNKLVFKEFRVNANNCLTLPSLAMRIYTSNFKPAGMLFQLVGPIADAIRSSYTGGAVDVYKPHNKILYPNWVKKFNKLYYYDVNSLYPYVMACKDMPVGMPKFFEGDITKYIPDAFGFFYCKITSPNYLDQPILQQRIKFKGGVRTVAGLGSWEGYIFSEEMNNAIKFGYKFEVIKGYLFDRGDLFSGYVNKMYALRQQYSKSDPMNLVAKLLMNSLYGKFGQKLEVNKVVIHKNEDVQVNSFIKQLPDSLHTLIPLKNHTMTISKEPANIKYDSQEEMHHGVDVNVALSSAVTSYARVLMSEFKNTLVGYLYYSDTDSAVVDRPLPAHMVGDKLGQLKLEHIVEKAIFLAPKVYILITDKGEKVVKVKGIKAEIADKLDFNDFDSLLKPGSSQKFNQEKWHTKLLEGEISVSDTVYTLRATSNKRQAVYIHEEYSDTKPYNYDDLV